jgi:hypothetical protein
MVNGYENIDIKGKRIESVVKEGKYKKATSRIGGKLEKAKGNNKWYMNVEYKRILEGSCPDIKFKPSYVGNEFNTKGTEEGKDVIGCGIGWKYKVIENITIDINCGCYAGKRYENINGMVKANYRF